MAWRIQTNSDFYSFDPFLAAGKNPEEAIAITVRDVCDQHKRQLDEISEKLYDQYTSAVQSRVPGSDRIPSIDQIWSNSKSIYEAIGISQTEELDPKRLFDMYSVLKYFIEANIVNNKSGWSTYYMFMPSNFEEIASEIEDDPQSYADENEASRFGEERSQPFDTHYPDYYNGGQKNFTGIYGFYKTIYEKIKKDPTYFCERYRLGTNNVEDNQGLVYWPNFKSAETILVNLFRFQFVTNKFRIEKRDEDGKLKPFRFNMNELTLPIGGIFGDEKYMQAMESVNTKEQPQGIVKGFFNDKIVKNTMQYIDYGKDLELPEEVSSRGYYAKLLNEPVDLMYNGWAMGHCVGSDQRYKYNVERGLGFAIEIGKDGVSKGTAYYFGNSGDDMSGFSEGIKNLVTPRDYDLMEFFGPKDHEPIPGVKSVLQILDEGYDGQNFGRIEGRETPGMEPYRDEMSDLEYMDNYLYEDHIPPDNVRDLEAWNPSYGRSATDYIQIGIEYSQSDEYQEWGDTEYNDEGEPYQIYLMPTDITDAVHEALLSAGIDAAVQFFEDPLDFFENFDKDKIEQYFIEFPEALNPEYNSYPGFQEMLLSLPDRDRKVASAAAKFFNDIANALYMTYQKLPKEYEAAGKFRDDLNSYDLNQVGVDDIKTENSLSAMAMFFASDAPQEEIDDLADYVLKEIKSARSQEEVISILNGLPRFGTTTENINRFFNLVEQYSQYNAPTQREYISPDRNKLFEQRHPNTYEYYDYHEPMDKFLDNAYQNRIIDNSLLESLKGMMPGIGFGSMNYLVYAINLAIRRDKFNPDQINQLKNLLSSYYYPNEIRISEELPGYQRFLPNQKMVQETGSDLVDSVGEWVPKTLQTASAKKESWEIVLDGDMGYDIVGAFDSWKKAHESVQSWLKDLSRGKLNPKEQDNTNISEDAKQQDAWALEDIKKAVEDERWSFHFCHDDHSYVLCLQPVGYKED